jgi:putative phage-type endonuclease
MKLDIEQGSKEWLNLRKTKITATDAAVIMGLNPWQTPYGLWMQKMGLSPPNEETEAMNEGKRLEPIALAKWNSSNKYPYSPGVFINDEREWQMASLDGVNELGALVEIKCSAKSLEMAKDGIIPDYYKAQMQHQMSVCNMPRMNYYVYYNDEAYGHIVERDEAFISDMLKKEEEFYKLMQIGEPPPMTAKDYIERDDEKWNVCAQGYLEVLESIKFLEDQKEYWRSQLIKLSDDKSCKGSGISVFKGIKKGVIDYKGIPELQSINLENYRKPSTEYWRINVK